MNIAGFKRRINKLVGGASDHHGPIDILIQIVEPGENGPVKVGEPFSISEIAGYQQSATNSS